jgi:hypothetical protein
MSRPSWNPTSIDCDKAREMASRGLKVAKSSILGKLIHTAKSILSSIMTVVNR